MDGEHSVAPMRPSGYLTRHGHRWRNEGRRSGGVQGDANRGGAPGGIRAFAPLARSPELTVWRARAQRIGPYLVGAAMFAIAVWVLRGALRRYGIEDLQSELSALTIH